MNTSKPCPILHNGTVTSRAAARSMEPIADGCRAQVLAALKKAGPNGLTREEISLDLGMPIQNVTGRVRELIILNRAREPLNVRKTSTGRAAKVVVAVF